MGISWNAQRLGDTLECVADNRGKNPKSYTDSGIPVIDNYLITSDWRVQLGRAKRYIDDETYHSFIRKHIQPDDVLVTLVGNGYGQVALSPRQKCVIIQNTIGLRCNKNHDNKFLYYLLKGNRASLINLNIGAAQPSIKVGNLLDLVFRFPPLVEQESIAHILGTLDDKIELNRQMNATLEAMAQALFKSWFVDFDPVIDNALAAGNTIPEPLQKRADARKALGDKRKPLPKEIQKLFPNSFAFTDEMGWVPEGWPKIALKAISSVIKGKSYKSAELSDSATALVTLKSFKRGGGYRLDGLKEYTGAFKPEQEVFPGELIIAYTDVTQAADVIGKPAMVVSDERYEKLVISLDVGVVRPNDSRAKNYIYGVAQTRRFQEHTRSYSTGTTVLHLHKDAVPEYLLPLPSPVLIEEYSNFVSPMYKTIDSNIINNRTLEALRDTLLPKLISGELRIPDAEKMVSDADE